MRLARSLLCLTVSCSACDHAPSPASQASLAPAPSRAPPVVAVATAPASASTAASATSPDAGYPARAPVAPSHSAAPHPAPAPASTCAKGWIDGCGSCYPPCQTDADCKVKGQTCQPIVCTHTSYGNGCLAP